MPPLAVPEMVARLRLSLDSLLVNGIGLGVLCSATAPGFIDQLTNQFLQDLGTLSSMTDDSGIHQLLDQLYDRGHRLVPLLQRLPPLQERSREEIIEIVTQITFSREEMMGLMVALDQQLGVDVSRSAVRSLASVTAVETFLDNLEAALLEAWSARHSNPVAS
jgi:hypothetical protein